MEFIKESLESSAKPVRDVEDSMLANQNERIAYATLLCNESYFNGVVVVIKTLRKHCSKRIPILCIVDNTKVSKSTRKRLQNMCEHVVEVETLLGSQTSSSTENSPWAASEMTKLRLWQLTDFDSIVYVDADCMVLSSLDDIFERCKTVDFAAAPDVFPPDKFNAGVLYLRPNINTFRALCEALPVLESYDGGDTGFLNAFFPDWYKSSSAARLPFGYNMQRTLYWFTYSIRPGYWDSIHPKKVVHFSSSPKPWETSMAAARGDLEWLWWETLMS